MFGLDERRSIRKMGENGDASRPLRFPEIQLSRVREPLDSS